MFGIGGNATFTVDPINGFQMQSFSVTSFTLFGVSGLSAPSGSGGAGSTGAASLTPTADLASPLEGAAVTGLPTNGGGRQYIDVTFNDVNGVGLNTAAIESGPAPFTIAVNGQPVSGLTIAGSPTPVAGEPNTFQYLVSGFPTTTGVVTVQFLPGAFADSAGNQDVGSTEQFYLVAAAGASPPPTAVLANPSAGQPVTAATLNGGGYIEVTYESLDGTAINQTALGTAAPFTLSGSGLDGVELGQKVTGLPGAVPVLVGAPLLISGSSSTATSVTYRYYLANSDSTGATPLFGAGTVVLSFITGAIQTGDGANGVGLTQSFTV